MKQQRGFTLIELVMVIVILGILAAVALPRFVNMSVDAETAATAGVAGALSSASAINFAARSANVARGVPITDCANVINAMQTPLPNANYVITAAPVAAGATVNCTLTNSNVTPNVVTTFTAIGIL